MYTKQDTKGGKESKVVCMRLIDSLAGDYEKQSCGNIGDGM